MHTQRKGILLCVCHLVQLLQNIFTASFRPPFVPLPLSPARKAASVSLYKGKLRYRRTVAVNLNKTVSRKQGHASPGLSNQPSRGAAAQAGSPAGPYRPLAPRSGQEANDCRRLQQPLRWRDRVMHFLKKTPPNQPTPKIRCPQSRWWTQA